MKCEACQHGNIDGARFCANCGALMPTASEAGADPMIGQLIGGRYRVTGVLGEGGMGIVYVGEQQMGSTVRKVAIKTLHAHLSKDPSVIARFHRECGTVAQLEHPNTIKFYDFGSTSDGTLYIAMEFVAGRPLADVIQHGPLAPDRVVKIMRQVCGALDEAHMQGIVHRDLKPENLFMAQVHDGEGRWRLACERDRFFGGFGCGHEEPSRFHRAGEALAKWRVVIDDQKRFVRQSFGG